MPRIQVSEVDRRAAGIAGRESEQKRAEKADESCHRGGVKVDMTAARDNGLAIAKIDAMINHNACEVFFDGLHIPADSLIGEEGKGFRYIVDSMNAERILIASECLGDATFFLNAATGYANDRTVFDRPIGQNQGIQFPLARAHAQTEAARLMVAKATALYEAGRSPGPEANMAKLLAADAAWAAAEAETKS